MGHHPNGNGQSGAHQFKPDPPVWSQQPPASPGHAPAVSDLAKGYVPVRWALAGVGTLLVAFLTLTPVVFHLGGVWTDQQNTIKTVQKDVDKLTIGQEQHASELRRIGTAVEKTQESTAKMEAALQKAVDNPPWYVSVKQAAR